MIMASMNDVALQFELARSSRRRAFIDEAAQAAMVAIIAKGPNGEISDEEHERISKSTAAGAYGYAEALWNERVRSVERGAA